jgi:ribonuclease D
MLRFSVIENEEEITRIIDLLADDTSPHGTLFLDLEIADYRSKSKVLALIQILPRLSSHSDECAYLLDVIDKPGCITHFIHKIMMNGQIIKVFHNKSFDLQYLGGNLCQNVMCTLQMARQLPYHALPTPNHKLDTITHHFLFNDDKLSDIEKEKLEYTDKEEMQTCDWGNRPLDEQQLQYAAKDVFALAFIYDHLQELHKIHIYIDDVDIVQQITSRMEEIGPEWKNLDSEMTNLQDRLKRAMIEHKVKETSTHKLSVVNRTVMHIPLHTLASIIEKKQSKVEFSIQLTEKLMKELEQKGVRLSDLEGAVTTTTQTIQRLVSKKKQSVENDED